MANNMILLIKQNGEVTFKEKKINTINEDYLTEKDGFLTDLIDVNEIKRTDMKTIEGVRKVVNSVLAVLTNNNHVIGNSSIISKIYEKLPQVNNEHDLDEIISLLVSKRNYYKEELEQEEKKENKDKEEEFFINQLKKVIATINSFEKASQYNKNLLLSILIKRIMVLYNTKLASTNSLSIISYMSKMNRLVLLDEDLDILVNKMYKETDNKEFDKLSKRILGDIVITTSKSAKKHLCWEDCEYAFADKCPKIRDYYKETHINKYPFIEEGWQTLDENGDVDDFIVTKCSKYEHAKPGPTRTAQEVKKIKDSLRTHYFDAMTVEEANRKQAEDILAGRILKPRGKEPKKELEELKREKKRLEALKRIEEENKKEEERKKREKELLENARQELINASLNKKQKTKRKTKKEQ